MSAILGAHTNMSIHTHVQIHTRSERGVEGDKDRGQSFTGKGDPEQEMCFWLPVAGMSVSVLLTSHLLTCEKQRALL